MIKTIKQTIKGMYYWIKDKVIRFKKWFVILIFGAVVVAAPLVLLPEIPDIALENIQAKYEVSELKDKYQLDGASLVKKEIKNAELDKYKNEPKDEIKITIGNKDLDKFTPDIELKRWNEVSFKLKPKGLDKIKDKDKSLKFDKDKIKFGTPDIDYEMYDYEDGYKYVWYLKKEPKTNIVEFDIEVAGLDFYRQPPLTEEFENGYSEEFKKEIIVSETQVKDLEGNVLVNRPENVVGSYVFYHKTKGGMVDAWGKDYGTGQAGIIYRPHIIDAEGKEEWGILNIENGIYSVEIPQDFLDNAVYPIKSNDTFGYEVAGGTTATAGTAFVYFALDTPTSAGTATKATAYVKGDGGSNYVKFKAVLYIPDAASADFVTNGSGNEASYLSPTPDWVDSAFPTGPSVVASPMLAGVINHNSNAFGDYYYNVAGSGGGWYISNYTNPTDLSGNILNSNRAYSVYITYTPSGGAERRMFLTQ